MVQGSDLYAIMMTKIMKFNENSDVSKNFSNIFLLLYCTLNFYQGILSMLVMTMKEQQILQRSLFTLYTITQKN